MIFQTDGWNWAWSELGEQDRQSDPIGMSALAEAIADLMLPGFSYRTTNVAEAIWSLVGRVWAEDQGRGRNEQRAALLAFERGLKLAWYDTRVNGGAASPAATFAGITAVRRQHEAGRWDTDYRLLANQFAQGMHGAYTRLLSAAGLVSEDPLVATIAGRDLASRIGFHWTGRGGRQHLSAFHRPLPRAVRQIIGARIFTPGKDSGLDPFQRSATAAITTCIASRGSAPSWAWVARHIDLPGPRGNQLRSIVAKADAFCSASVDLERLVAGLLQAEDAPLRGLRLKKSFPTNLGSWLSIAGKLTGQRLLTRAISLAVQRCRRSPKYAIYELHRKVWRMRGHALPWLQCHEGDIVRSPAARSFRPPERRTLRWEVASSLMAQTGWKP